MPEAARLTVVPDAAQVAPGERLSFALTVQHTGRSGTRYRLEVSGIPADWYDLDQPRLALLPATSAQVLLTVHPPAGPAAMAGRYTLTVQVQAEDEPALQAAAAVALTVRTGGLDMDVQPAEAVGRKGVFRVTFLNQMTWPVDVALTARDHEDGLRFHIEPETPLVVPATGVAGPITVQVVPRVRALLGAPHAYEIRLCGLDLAGADASTPSLVRWARFVYVPRFPGGRLPHWLRRAPGWTVLLPLLLLLLLLVGSRTLARPTTRPAATPSPAPARAISRGLPTRPRAAVQGVLWSRPSIRRFTLVQRRRGQPYALVWQTRGAAHVTLDGRPVAAQGQLAVPAPLRSGTHRLVAATGARCATARLHVVVDALTPDPHAVVLTRPEIDTFAVRRHKGRLYATWRVRNAVHVWLQGRAVAQAGAGPVPRGTSRLRLVASNDVGSRQRLLPLARIVPPATPRPTAPPAPPSRPTAAAHPSRARRLATMPRPTWTPPSLPPPMPTPTPHPTATPTPRPTTTPIATPTPRPTTPTATFPPPPTGTPTIRPATLSTLRPTGTPAPRPTIPPTRTATPPATAAPTRRPTATPLPIALRTMVPGVITTPPPPPAPVPPAGVLNADAVDFGRQRVGTTSAVQIIDVDNPDPAPLRIRSVTITGDAAGDFGAADTCAGVTLSADGQCTVSIRFSPRTSGVRRASLVISGNGAAGTWEVLLRGRGV